MSIKSDIGTYGLIAGIGFGLAGQANAQTQTKGPPPVFGKAAKPTSQVNKKPVKSATSTSAKKTGKKKSKSLAGYEPKAPEITIRMPQMEIVIPNAIPYLVEQNKIVPPTQKALPFKPISYSDMFAELIMGNDPRYFQLGSGWKMFSPNGQNYFNPRLIWNTTRAGEKAVDANLDTKFSHILLGLGVTPTWQKTGYNSDLTSATSSLTPIANGAASRNSTQRDQTNQNVDINGNKVAFKVEYNKNGYVFGWEQSNGTSKTEDLSTILSQYGEDYADSTFRIEDGLEVATRTIQRTDVNVNTKVNAVTSRVDNMFRAYFALKNFSASLNLGASAYSANVKTNTSIETNLAGFTDVAVTGNGIADTSRSVFNAYNQSTDSSAMDIGGKTRTAFLNLAYDNLIKNHVRAEIVVPMKSGPEEHMGFNMTYRDLNGKLIGVAQVGVMGGNYNLNAVFLGGNAKEQKAVAEYLASLNNLSNAVWMTDNMKDMIMDETKLKIQRALKGKMIDAKLEKTPGQTPNFGVELSYGNNGKGISAGYETLPRKTKVGAWCKDIGCNYEFNKDGGKATAYYQRGLKK